VQSQKIAFAELCFKDHFKISRFALFFVRMEINSAICIFKHKNSTFAQSNGVNPAIFLKSVFFIGYSSNGIRHSYSLSETLLFFTCSAITCNFQRTVPLFSFGCVVVIKSHLSRSFIFREVIFFHCFQLCFFSYHLFLYHLSRLPILSKTRLSRTSDLPAHASFYAVRSAARVIQPLQRGSLRMFFCKCSTLGVCMLMG
jgi:hypothetical protein